MSHRTDLQLILVEEIFEMDTENLIDLFKQMRGHDLTIYNDESEQMNGSLEILDISDPPQLKKPLGFLLNALGERVGTSASDKS